MRLIRASVLPGFYGTIACRRPLKSVNNLFPYNLAFFSFLPAQSVAGRSKNSRDATAAYLNTSSIYIH